MSYEPDSPSGVKKHFPGEEVWVIDPGHSTLQFEVRHLMISKVRGWFRDFSGEIRFGKAPDECSVELVAKSASIDSRLEKRDAHLRAEGFLYVERYPTLSFRSKSFEVEPNGAIDRCRLVGQLEIRGVTREVAFDVSYLGLIEDPWGSRRLGFSATTEIDRRDFGVNWNDRIPAGGVVVGNRVRIEVEIEAASPGASL